MTDRLLYLMAPWSSAWDARGREDDAGAFPGTVASHAFLFEFGRVDNLPGLYFEDRAEAGTDSGFPGKPGHVYGIWGPLQ